MIKWYTNNQFQPLNSFQLTSSLIVQVCAGENFELLFTSKLFNMFDKIIQLNILYYKIEIDKKNCCVDRKMIQLEELDMCLSSN